MFGCAGRFRPLTLSYTRSFVQLLASVRVAVEEGLGSCGDSDGFCSLPNCLQAFLKWHVGLCDFSVHNFPYFPPTILFQLFQAFPPNPPNQRAKVADGHRVENSISASGRIQFTAMQKLCFRPEALNQHPQICPTQLFLRYFDQLAGVLEFGLRRRTHHIGLLEIVIPVPLKGILAQFAVFFSLCSVIKSCPLSAPRYSGKLSHGNSSP